MRMLKTSMTIIGIFLLVQFFDISVQAAPQEKIDPSARCPVCGMFVAKYPNWITQIRHADGSVKVFDGVKDLMAYYFDSKKYGGEGQETIHEIWVRDYYTLQWLDGRKAFYVTDSDVYGPMGREFIPFDTQKAAESFLKDHHGKKVVTFEEITPELVNSMHSM